MTVLPVSPDSGSNGTGSEQLEQSYEAKGKGLGEERLEVSKAWRLTSTETVRLIRDGEKVPGGGAGTEVVGEGDYIPIATLSPPE